MYTTNFFRIAAWVAVLGCPYGRAAAAGRTFNVTNIEKWEYANAEAQEGDTIQLFPEMDGQMMTLTWKAPRYSASTTGCRTSPALCLTIRGVGAKQTIFTAGQLMISRSNVVVKNLKFRSNRLDVIPLKVQNAPGKTLANVRLTDLLFEKMGPAQMDTSITRMNLYVGALAVRDVPFPVKDVRIDSSYFAEVNYSIVIRVTNFVQNVQIDHNYFRDSARCPDNGCDAIHLGTGLALGESEIDPYMYASVNHNKFIRMKGESELISSKSWGNKFWYNLAVEPRGAIVFRTGKESVARRNVVVDPESYPFRAHGADHEISENVMVLARPAEPIILFYGTDTYSDGSWKAPTCVQNPADRMSIPYDPVRRLVIRRNWFASSYPLYGFAMREDVNCGCDFKTQAPIACTARPGIASFAGNIRASDAAPEVVALRSGAEARCVVFRKDASSPSPWNGFFSVIDCAKLVVTDRAGMLVTEEHVNLGTKYFMR